MQVVTSRSPTARQLSALGPDGLPILSVLAKRTYSLGRRCTLHAEQLALRLDPVVDPERDGLLIADLEIYPFKPLTDVIVRGHAYGHGRRGVHASVAVGRNVRRLAVLGDRRASLSASGQVRFSEPEPFERVPLEYDRAYGGWDVAAEDRFPNPFAALAGRVPENVDIRPYSPCVYPRNRHGRGYLLHADTGVEDIPLPNIEDPDDLLTPERLVVEHPRQWFTMPLPCGTSWVHPGAFSRSVYLGAFPFWQPLPDALAEVERAYVPAEVRGLHLFRREPLMMRFMNGASLGLQFAQGELGGSIVLEHLHPTHTELVVELPSERPRIWIDGRKGKLTATEPVIHHVEIEPDHDRLAIVWRGSAPALRPYYPEEIDAMPFRVEWSEP